VVEGYADDPIAQELLTSLAVDQTNSKGYSLDNGVIRFKGRVWLGTNRLAQEHVMQALHISAVGGHLGGLATYQWIKSLFAWPVLRERINQFVQACTTCQ